MSKPIRLAPDSDRAKARKKKKRSRETLHDWVTREHRTDRARAVHAASRTINVTLDHVQASVVRIDNGLTDHCLPFYA